ncbi:UDP-glucose flavonoid 3-O-glucosyltransferase 6 [Hibiscus syriacus]|uniref:Glycosyltransferase n=1 Tax=Hibiscus syriacus TaxID=106335 RepID=A0A6A2Z2D0_HIBSY|nr:anthocyanidin 3-O-glucosyltransferase 6-like [Hibiscus syriacus]KAE8685887.1 UDP-glucose flavonoid 3-O-glucosyltransferase 6 [Hibiscus syriacus]
MTKRAELVFIPAPGMGHLVPTVQLAKLLVHLNSSLSITILTVKPPYDAKICAYVDSLSADRTSTTINRIKFINLPHPDPDVDVLKFISGLVHTQRSFVKETVTNIVELSNSVPDSPRLAGFVLDMLLTGFVDLANEFGVPSYVFYTSGAAFLGFEFYVQVLHDEQSVKLLELKDSETEFTIPSYVNPVSTRLIPFNRTSSEVVTFFLDMGRRLREVKGIMVNTFSELESHAIDSLSNHKLRNPAIYPVGPILDFSSSSETHHNHDTIMQWMDEQPPSSVVFLCFGSMGSFSVEQVTEIANALEQSGYRFLWSLRRPGEKVNGIRGKPTDYGNMADALPEGFLDRTAKVGKVTGWVPQAAVLSHPATGGFVSHCGWNSTLESIWFRVPMAAWPHFGEQHMNAFLLVKELGIAIDLKMDYKNYGDEVEIVKADEIERGIRWLMDRDSDVRKKMKNIGDRSSKALLDGGTSQSTLRRFIDDVIDNLS